MPDFSVAMRPVGRVALGAADAGQLREGERVVVKLAQMKPDSALPPQFRGIRWAWAIIQEMPGQPDRIIVGGAADSMTEAAARGESELTKHQALMAGRKEER